MPNIQEKAIASSKTEQQETLFCQSEERQKERFTIWVLFLSWSFAKFITISGSDIVQNH